MIRGIDAQIMMARSLDLARDVGAMAQRPEAGKDFLAAQAKAEAMQDQKKIEESPELEQMRLRAEADGGGNGGGGSAGGGEAEDGTTEGALAPGLRVAQRHSIIDIKV